MIGVIARLKYQTRLQSKYYRHKTLMYVTGCRHLSHYAIPGYFKEAQEAV